MTRIEVLVATLAICLALLAFAECSGVRAVRRPPLVAPISN